MKIRLIFFLVSSLPISGVFAQSSNETTPGKKAISVSANLPVGVFSTTHLIGIGVDYSPNSAWLFVTREKPFVFTYNAGVAYYFGKKETVSAYPYKYPGYLVIHAAGGVLFNTGKFGMVTLSAGPALGIYNGNTRFNIGSKMELSYYVSKSVAIGPGIIFLKESGADPIWSAAFKATIVL